MAPKTVSNSSSVPSENDTLIRPDPVVSNQFRVTFEVDEPSPFMERVLPIRADKHEQIPAVTHVDGSGRLQTVSRAASPLYWELIDTFRRKTGVPIILNTSLNENEPIVRTPAEAISCFLRTSMDMLVLGNVVIDRASISRDKLASASDARHPLPAES